MLKDTTSLKCHYCEAECDSDLVEINNHVYCCYGCATLDDVVSKIQTQPEDVKIQYKQFDHPDVFGKIIEFQNDKIYKISISLPAIHCASCIELLEDLPSFNSLVQRTVVNFETKTCTVWASKELPVSMLAQLLDNVGYPPQISPGKKAQKESVDNQRTLLFKMAFAGFCFGNIMLYSMPHYFGLQALNDPFFSGIFTGLSIALSIPLLAYSGREYLESAYKALLRNKAHIHIPIALGIVSLWVWSIYEIISGTGSGYLDSLSGLIFFLLVGKWFQTRIYDQVSYKRELEEFIPLLVRRKVDAEQTEWIKTSELRKGDRIVVKNNEVIPVDGVLLSPKALIDYSFITGEQIPERSETMDDVFAGGRQLQGQIEVGVQRKPDENKLWSAWRSESGKVHEAGWTNKVSKYFTWVVLSTALISGLIWYFIDASQAAFVVSAVLIVACPCALALSAPFTYGNILRVFSKNNLFVKQAEAIHSMASIRSVVFDKTGTLTKRNQAGVSYEGRRLTDDEQSMIYTLVSASTHPLSQSLTQYLSGQKTLKVNQMEEFPGKGIAGIVNGASLKIGSTQWLHPEHRSSEGSKVAVEIDEEFAGIFFFDQVYRSETLEILQELGEHYQLSLLSGDNEQEKETLRSLHPNWSNMLFNLKPQDKSHAIEELQRKNGVAMIGDGINDGLALSKSDMGIALTDSLNDFYPGSDAVLISDKLNKLPSLFELARYSNTILRWSLVFSLIYNLGGLAFAVTGNLTPVVAAILMPLSSISVVSLDALLVQLKANKLKLK